LYEREAGENTLTRPYGPASPKGRGFVAHRIVGRRGRQLITRGDSLRRNDAPVHEEQVLGRVVCVTRNGRHIGLEFTRKRRMAAWVLRRSDLVVPALRRGRIRQSANPYSIDAVLRIVHSLVLAGQGGMLVHAASAVRNGRAFLFAGVSGAGKTTISRLAPPDATLLTDEISYLRREGAGYTAYGTPFAGELGKPGENIRAPLAALYLLAKGRGNTIEPVGATEAARALLESILFFAHDSELVGRVFESACELVSRV